MKLSFQTNFDKEKINNFFRNIYTLNLLNYLILKKIMKKLVIHQDEIMQHLLGLFQFLFSIQF